MADTAKEQALAEAKQAQLDATSKFDEVVAAHRTASAKFLEAGELEEAAEELVNASIRLETTNVQDAIDCLEDAVRLFGQAGNSERAAESAHKACMLLSEHNKAPTELARIYMVAKNHYGNAGMYDESGKMYVSEMNARAKTKWLAITAPGPFNQRLQHAAQWIGLQTWRLTCLYGEGLGRFFVVNLMTILLFALLYWRMSALGPQHAGFLDALTYSAATFPTFGFGRLNIEAGNSATFLAVAEAFVGTASFGMFTSILVRRLSRR